MTGEISAAGSNDQFRNYPFSEKSQFILKKDPLRPIYYNLISLTSIKRHNARPDPDFKSQKFFFDFCVSLIKTALEQSQLPIVTEQKRFIC